MLRGPQDAGAAGARDVDVTHFRRALSRGDELRRIARAAGHAVAPDDAHEFLNVVPADAELRHATLREGRRAEFVGALADVIQLMFGERAPLEVAALARVVRVERDQERRHAAESFEILLLVPRALLAAGADRHLLALADDPAHLANVLDGRPEVGDVGVDEVHVGIRPARCAGPSSNPRRGRHVASVAHQRRCSEAPNAFLRPFALSRFQPVMSVNRTQRCA